jgi:hypothetical protein
MSAMSMRRIAFALGVVFGVAVLLGAAPAGAGDGASAEGGSHLVLHDVFGLQTLELQNFGFSAKIKADGSADGWYTYREVDDGSPNGVGSLGETQAFCDTHPPYKHPFPIDGGNIQVGAP